MLLHSVREKSLTFSLMAMHRFSSTNTSYNVFLVSIEKNNLTYNHSLN